jgi:hypothetical protein
MNDLLNRDITSHGGLERWNKITLLESDVSVTGSTWSRKGWPDAPKNVHVSAHAQDQWISYGPFTGGNKRSRCTPAHTVIENARWPDSQTETQSEVGLRRSHRGN